jgi:hypothetical protein
MSTEPRHYLTGELVLKESWDVEAQALRTIPATNTEWAIELSHEDGDSVISHVPCITLVEGVHDVSGMSTLCLFGEAALSISPDESGEEFHTITPTALVPTAVCARRIKIVGSGKVVVRG